ncbi:hypothetical protein DV096_10480 [Bradymonadaceae bacterium TMQ3]|uniref:Outer membrane protein beta-barrel domain-containing protein n=1 Tax=Lujinxingia sediminis TaxID=2480984 RepID=A0ABY0CSR4_9DELT|nr:hypothetical protein [Lujinxingia sediminis]RDV38230.1 hypothetical protein DV096_10480 [Bradymonadaceae bacterium TMQ3]RVU43571.1 hypothetical protein EA187_12145 [Lujinxingia sediminis]TXC75900.1 hypothetical protein FRC91_10385 [Bradymonadales bacterium TMQ1]
MRWIQVWLATVVTTAVLVGSVTDAQAVVRAGVDVRWMPVALEDTKLEEVELGGSQRQLESLGAGARLMLGFDAFAIGAKVNIARHTFADPDLSYTQVDTNLQARFILPSTRLALYVEAGPSIALDLASTGYNAGIGAEVDVLGWPLVDLNLGIGAQYARVPVNAGPGLERINEGLRAIVYVGFDFSM